MTDEVSLEVKEDSLIISKPKNPREGWEEAIQAAGADDLLLDDFPNDFDVARVDVVRQFDIHLVSLDPTRGAEMKKTRPCIIISPDEMNTCLKTVIIAPLTSSLRKYPFRISCLFQGKKGQIALDQMRTVDKRRLLKRIGSIHQATAEKSLLVLQKMFS